MSLVSYPQVISGYDTGKIIEIGQHLPKLQ